MRNSSVAIVVGMAFVIALGFAAFLIVHSRHKEAERHRMEAEREQEALEREKRQADSEPHEGASEDPSLLEKYEEAMQRIARLEDELERYENALADLGRQLEEATLARHPELRPVSYETLSDALAALKEACAAGEVATREAALRAIREFLSTDPGSYGEVIEFIKTQQDPGIVELLSFEVTRAMSDEELPASLRQVAMKRLVDLLMASADPGLQTALLKGLTSGGRSLPSAQLETLVALARFGQEARVRRATVHLLGKYADQEEVAVALLDLARSEQNPDVKRACLPALEHMPASMNQQVEQFMLELMETEDNPEILGEAIIGETLFSRVTHENKDRFAERLGGVLVRTSSTNLRGRCMISLGALIMIFNSEKALPVLRGHLERESDPVLIELGQELIHAAEEGSTGLGEFEKLIRRYRDRIR